MSLCKRCGHEPSPLCFDETETGLCPAVPSAHINDCTTCYGRGYTESPADWFGRAECGMCKGFGVALETTCVKCGETLETHLNHYDDEDYDYCDFDCTPPPK